MSDIVPAESKVPEHVLKALAWQALGFTEVYSVRLKVAKDFRHLLIGDNPGECHELLAVPPLTDWPAVIKQVETKHKDVFDIMFFYRMGNVYDLFLKDHSQLIEE